MKKDLRIFAILAANKKHLRILQYNCNFVTNQCAESKQMLKL